MPRTSDARRVRLLLGALVIGHLVVISRQVDGGGGASLLERSVFTVLSPFQRAVGFSVRVVREAWAGYVDLRRTHAENQRLQERVQSLETLLEQHQHQAAESGRLRELLELRKTLPLETVPAEVIARDGLPWSYAITIDKGTHDEVNLNAAVISSRGVVGRVIRCGPTAARVQLLVDRDSRVGVLIERSRVSGVASGETGSAESGTTELLMKYVPGVADVVVGDLVVTSGLDRIFPKGLVVGSIRAAGRPAGLFRERILITPSARFDELEEVMVVTGTKSAPALPETVR